MMEEFMPENIQVNSIGSPVESNKSAKPQNRFAWLGPFGAVITAILASLCCVAPFVLISLGVTGAWIGSLRAFEPYRPIFILFILGFLSAGFYQAYWKKTKGCEPGSVCDVPKTQKAGKIMLWGATFFAVFLMILPYLIGWFA